MKRGDIVHLDNHILMCGDSRTEDLQRLINDEDVKLLLSDPPYGVNRMNGDTKMIDQIRPVSFTEETRKNSYNSVDFPIFEGDKDFTPDHLVKLNIPMVLFGGNYYHDRLPNGKKWYVWYKKKNIVTNLKSTWSDCELIYTTFKGTSCKLLQYTWNGMSRRGERRLELKTRNHPTQKPVGLLMYFLEQYTEPGDTILDPYGGGGSTLIACAETGRRCLMMEILPEYCSRIIDRYNEYKEKTIGTKQQQILEKYGLECEN